ncbi:MAG: ribose 5-phosphate isomerase B [Ignavibacteria bacterium]
MKKIAVGSDHTGFDIKEILKKFLTDRKYEVIDCGTFDRNSCDYPDFAMEVSKKVVLREVCVGILIDATGIPSAITANKFPGIRASTCYNEFSAFSSRSHNDANVLVLGAKTLGEETIKSIVNVWLKTEFEGGRHQKRLNKITALEKAFIDKE